LVKRKGVFMKDISGKALGIGVGTSLGYAMNTLDKKGKGPTVPEYILKGVATAVLYNYALENDNRIIGNCALGYISFESVRMTRFGRTETNSLNGNEKKMISNEMKKAVMNPEVVKGVGNALMGISNILGTFRSSNGSNSD
jgi:hypothetical protein